MSTIRPVRPEDTPQIHALIARIFADYGYAFEVERENPHLADPANWFRRSGGEFWVVEHEGQVIATGGVLLHDDEAELRSLYVAPEHRRCGLGRRLTQMAIEHARAAGRPRIVLWTDLRFTEAHKLYESLGFVRSGRRSVASTNSFCEHFYELELD